MHGRKRRRPLYLSTDLFTAGMGDQTRVRFHREGGKVSGFDLLTDDGQAISVNRTS